MAGLLILKSGRMGVLVRVSLVNLFASHDVVSEGLDPWVSWSLNTS